MLILLTYYELIIINTNLRTNKHHFRYFRTHFRCFRTYLRLLRTYLRCVRTQLIRVSTTLIFISGSLWPVYFIFIHVLGWRRRRKYQLSMLLNNLKTIPLWFRKENTPLLSALGKTVEALCWPASARQDLLFVQPYSAKTILIPSASIAINPFLYNAPTACL